jgi:predicted phosphoribosyltransferase
MRSQSENKKSWKVANVSTEAIVQLSIYRIAPSFLVDDGLATGATMRAAALALRQRRPLKIVIAVPVAPAETCEAFRNEVEEVI